MSAVRAFWFRMSAVKTRWWEESVLVPEEMRRTYRYFLYYQKDRLERAKGWDVEGNEGAAGYARRYGSWVVELAKKTDP